MRHQDLPSINVAVRLMGDYGDAHEHPDPNPHLGYKGSTDGRAQREMSTFIESKDDNGFEIVISVEDDPSLDEWIYDEFCLEFQLLVDGSHMGKRNVKACNLRRNGRSYTYTTQFIGAKGPGRDPYQKELRRFVFSSLTTGFIPGTRDRQQDGRDNTYKQTDHRISTSGYPYSEISEEALKGRALSHSTSYAIPEDITGHGDGRRPRTRIVDRGRPVMSYLFKYRSMEGLKKEGVVQRTPPPDYDDAVPKMESLPQHEIERLARVKLIQMKRDHDRQREPLTNLGTNEAARRGGKRHIDEVYSLNEEVEGGRPRKIFRMDPSIPVIDLTDE
ncbi:hypothetical protein D7B24_002156 [Verticillium nonalfalfae]|uniref:DUF7918 domain-containing protein n=1 Tax=Verticillium nonalfalfae TaxID=1051616 RepID=A0A3M9YG54_9PEZI|nr:uncharacterized protein D7B24_002156 [Verticillium nonalfalfae]RNJ59547.1 hypothetical protein D7B24_002156 [Verticillium nonalfalfae]